MPMSGFMKLRKILQDRSPILVIFCIRQRMKGLQTNTVLIQDIFRRSSNFTMSVMVCFQILIMCMNGLMCLLAYTASLVNNNNKLYKLINCLGFL